MALELNTTEDGRVQFHGLFEDLQMGPLLLWLLEEEQQGELTVTTDGQQQIIYIADGYPVGTRGGPAENFLGWVLREKGHIDDNAYLTSLQKMAEEQQLQGQILLQMGAISQEQLMDALVLQLRRKLIRLFRPVQGEFHFLSAEDLDIFDVEIGAISPYTLTANAVRQEFSKDRLNNCLQTLDGFAIRLDPDGNWRAKTKDLGLEGDEIAALSLLEPWNSVENFLAQGYLDPIPSQVLIALLFSTNLLELDDEELAAVGRVGTNVAAVHTQAAPAHTQAAHAPTPTQEEDVSIRVETAKRPGAAPDPNAPRTRASVTVRTDGNSIQTQTHEGLDAVSTGSAGDSIEVWSSSAHKSVESNESDGTDPAIESVSPLVFASAATPIGAMPGEFVPPQDDDAQTDPSLAGITQDQLEAIRPTQPSRPSRPSRPTPPAQPSPPSRPIIAGPPPGSAVIAGPPPAPSGAVIAGPPPAPSGAVIAGPPPASNAAVIAGPPPAAPRPKHTPPNAANQARNPRPSGGAAPVEGRAAAPQGGGDGLSAEDQAHLDAVIAKKKSVEDATYYAVLEIDSKADADEVRKAYYAQSRTYHPDRVAGTPLEHLKDDLDLIFSQLNVSYSTLSNPEERKEYDEKLADPEAAALEERAPKAAQAEVFYSKANVYLKKRDYANAEEQLQWAAKLLPDEGDFQMTLAWAIYNNPDRDRQDSVQKALFHLENANECANADPQKMHFYWGHILKEENNLEGALSHFNALLKVNPRHVEAVREVRYLKMQLRTERDGPKEEAKGANKKGLFGFLKK